MSDEANNPAAAGTGGELTVESAAGVFEKLLRPEAPVETDTVSSERTNDDEDRAEDTAPDADAQAEAEDGDEAAGTDQADEADQSDNDDSTDDSDQEPAPPARVKLPDGGEVTLEELTKGYLRQADYTRKTQEIADQRRDVTAKSAEIAQLNSALLQRLQTTEAILKASLPQPPDPRLREQDPIEFLSQESAYRARMQQLQAVMHERQQAEQRTTEQTGQQQQEYVRSETEKLLAAVPELKDKAKGEEFARTILSGAQEYGLSEAEIRSVADHRHLLILRDAIAYRKLQASKPKAVEKAKDAPPVQRPGRRPSQAEQVARVRAEKLKQLRKTGRPEDAAAIFMDLV